MTQILAKSNAKSFFLNFHCKSVFAEALFEPNPTHKGKPIEILQIAHIEKGYIICECIYI